MAEDLARNAGLAKHGYHADAPIEPTDVLPDHPFGDVEIRTAGDGMNAAQVVRVGLRRQVAAAERSYRGVRDPGRIAKHQNRVREGRQRGVPVVGKEIDGIDAEPAVARSASAGSFDITRIAVVAMQLGVRESTGRSHEKRAFATSGFDHCSWPEARRGDQAAHSLGEGRRRLEVAVLDLARTRHRRLTPATVFAL